MQFDRDSMTAMHVPTGHCAVFQDNSEAIVEIVDSSTFGPVKY